MKIVGIILKFSEYKVNSGKHRTPPAKSNRTQWLVDPWQELSLFCSAYDNEWVDSSGCLWAAKKGVGSKPAVLGTTGSQEVYLAKYVQGSNDDWHGYPVSTSRQGDRPPDEVIKDFIEKGIIDKSCRQKILKGKL
ncbi:MAG: hypothetical protein KYX62_05920 [Pseudomonadota bacterium]|nr:hypothetical protein [Pseudomonadota bacterium]